MAVKTARILTGSPVLFDPGEGLAQSPSGVLALELMANDYAEKDLVALALALGARDVRGWSSQEQALIDDLPPISPEYVAHNARKIQNGHDPLGEVFCALPAPAQCRSRGATYTPLPIVRAMVDRAGDIATPVRVVDPGTGSGRYIVAAGRRFKHASLIGVEQDPLAAITARATLAAAGLADRSQVVLGDYRQFTPPLIDGARCTWGIRLTCGITCLRDRGRNGS